MLRVEGLHKSFGSVHAVAGVSFQALDGQVTGLVGPNGAGKTTSLRMLYGLLRPDSGQAFIDGVDAVRSPLQARARLGVLPDGAGLYGRLTGRENIRYYADLNLIPHDLAQRRVEALIEPLDMAGVIDRPAAGYSQGERMKVAIARALVHDPPNVVLDEPTNGLDVMSTRAMRGVMRHLAKEGRCVLFSSHQMAEIQALCDHIVVIAHGRVVAEGSPEQLSARTGQANLEEAFVQLVNEGAQP